MHLGYIKAWKSQLVSCERGKKISLILINHHYKVLRVNVLAFFNLTHGKEWHNMYFGCLHMFSLNLQIWIFFGKHLPQF